MNMCRVCIGLAFLMLMPSLSFGFKASMGENCSSCHVLKKDEAAALLKEMFRDVKVLEVRTLPLRSLWEVDVESGGRKWPVYIDFSKRFLFSGALIDLKEKRDLTKERSTDMNRVDVSKIPISDALVLGDRNAHHKVIVFDDPD